MADLSPAAQAVLDALWLDELNGPQQLMARAHAAAALRALADHKQAPIRVDQPIDHWTPTPYTRQELRNIAEELEGCR